MAAPAGSGAVEAYKNTKSRKPAPGVYVKDFVPTASPRLMDESALRDVASVKNTLEAAKHTDPFKSTTAKELPPGTYGGRKKSRRRRTRRRGGAMSKPIPQLIKDLEENPDSEAVVRNVLSDLKASGIPELVGPYVPSGEEVLGDLQYYPDPKAQIRAMSRMLIWALTDYYNRMPRGEPMEVEYPEDYPDAPRPGRAAPLAKVGCVGSKCSIMGGRRRKTTRRRK